MLLASRLRTTRAIARTSAASGQKGERKLKATTSPLTPTVLNFFCYWLCQIPLAIWLAYSTGLGASGVFVAVVVSDTLLVVGGIVMFRRGTWKTRTV